MESASDAHAAAIRLHQLGRLANAESLYRRVIERDPKHPGALHLLGALAHQQGHDDRAAKLIALAMELKPLQATYHSNYGVALRGLGRLHEAADALRLALRLWPEYPDAHSNLLTKASAVRTWTRLSDYPEALAGSRVPNRAWENALDPATVLIVNDDRTSRHDGARRERAAVDVRVSPNHASIADR